MTPDDATPNQGSRPPTYRIEVLGHLPDGLTAELTDFTIQTGPDTTLTGPVSDAAALYGVIARLESLGLTLLSVQLDHARSDPNGMLGAHAGTTREVRDV